MARNKAKEKSNARTGSKIKNLKLNIRPTIAKNESQKYKRNKKDHKGGHKNLKSENKKNKLNGKNFRPPKKK